MRIEYKEHNQQDNSEETIVHESDLTKQEKRRMEWEKIKGLGWEKRLPYLWTYYKIWLLVPVLLIAVIMTGVQIYQNSLKDPILFITVSDTALESDAGIAHLSEDLLQICGSGNRHEVIPVTTSLLSAGDYTASMQMSVWLGTGDMDIVICDEETCRTLQEQGIFMDWADISADANTRLQKYMKDGMLYLEQSNWTKYGLVLYTPACAGILNTSKHVEAAEKALLYLCGETE